MNFSRLAKYFSGKLPNSEKMDISDFVKILGNIDIDWDFISEYGAKFWGVKSDYEGLFGAISGVEHGEKKILAILEYFELSKSFIEMRDYENYEVTLHGTENITDLTQRKSLLLTEIESALQTIKKSKNNKANGNAFEDIAERFLLESSYFYPWFKEFAFEDGTEKIDRLLKLKKDIGNFWKETWYLWYVIVEAKYRKEKENAAGEVAQLKSYIERFKDYWISKYTIVITSTEYKDTYREIIWDYSKKQVIQNHPFYLSLLTIEDIREFLRNQWCYKDMTFDEYIEKSFIKWLK